MEEKDLVSLYLDDIKKYEILDREEEEKLDKSKRGRFGSKK